jgi:hypothetical protein
LGVGSGLWLGLAEPDALGPTDGFGEGSGVAVALGVDLGVAFGVGLGVADGFGIGDWEGLGVGRGVPRGVGVGTASSESVGEMAGSDAAWIAGIGSPWDASGVSSTSGACDSFDSAPAGNVGSELAADVIPAAAASLPNEPGLTQTIFSSFLSGWYSEIRRSTPRSNR